MLNCEVQQSSTCKVLLWAEKLYWRPAGPAPCSLFSITTGSGPCHWSMQLQTLWFNDCPAGPGLEACLDSLFSATLAVGLPLSATLAVGLPSSSLQTQCRVCCWSNIWQEPLQKCKSKIWCPLYALALLFCCLRSWWPNQCCKAVSDKMYCKSLVYSHKSLTISSSSRIVSGRISSHT
jgi:hypothetical protein